MLGFFRRLINSKVGLVVTFVFLGLVALAFAAADVGSMQMGGGPAGSVVAKVGDTRITANDLRDRVRGRLQQLRQEQPTLDMAQFVAGGGVEDVLEQMLVGASLEEFGQQSGMRVSPKLVGSELAEIPALKGANGKFDQRLYERLLQQNKLTDQQVQADIARSTMAQFLTVPTVGASQMPRKVTLPYASLLLEKRTGQVASVPVAAMPTGAAPSEAELKAFYDKNTKAYTIPERRVMRYARVTPEQVATAAQPTDAEIAQAYRTAENRFAATQKRDVTQVVVLDRAAAATLAQKVRSGTAIGEAARAAGLEASAVTGVDKNSYAGQTSAAAADAVFGATQGAVVGPVAGAVGFVVAKVEKVSEVAGKTLAQARDELAAELRQQKTNDLLGQLQSKVDDALAEDASFNEVVADQKLTPATTAPLTAQGVDPDKPGAPDPALAPIIQAGFAAEEGDTPVMVSTGQDGSFAIVALDRVIRSAPRPLAQIRDQVVADFRADRARTQAKATADAIAAKVRSGTAIADAVRQAQMSLPPVRTLSGTRAELTQRRDGLDPATAVMFSMVKGGVKVIPAPDGNGFVVFKLDDTVPGDASKVPPLIEATRRDLGRLIGTEYVEQFARAVQAELKVSRDEGAIAAVKRDLLGNGGQDQ